MQAALWFLPVHGQVLCYLPSAQAAPRAAEMASQRPLPTHKAAHVFCPSGVPPAPALPPCLQPAAITATPPALGSGSRSGGGRAHSPPAPSAVPPGWTARRRRGRQGQWGRAESTSTWQMRQGRPCRPWRSCMVRLLQAGWAHVADGVGLVGAWLDWGACIDSAAGCCWRALCWVLTWPLLKQHGQAGVPPASCCTQQTIPSRCSRPPLQP